MAYKFFDKKASNIRGNKFAGGAVKNENVSNQELHTNQLLENLKSQKYTHLL